MKFQTLVKRRIDRVWKGLPGIHDLSRIQCGTLETLNGIRDLTKIQYGIRETLNGIRICIGNSIICSDIWHKYHE